MANYPPLLQSSIILGINSLTLTVSSSLGPISTSTRQFHPPRDHHPNLPDSSIIRGTIADFYLTVLSSWWPLPISTWQFHHPEGPLAPSTCQLNHPGEHYLPLSACANTLETTHHYLTVDNQPLPDSSLILVTTTQIYLTVTSSWGPQPTSIWQFHLPRDNYPPLPDSSIILEPTSYFYLTCPSSWGPLPFSTWQFRHSGYHCLFLPDSSIILWTTTNINLTFSSLWGNLTFPSSWDQYPPLPDSFIIMGTTTLYLTVPSIWDNYSPLPDSCIILGTTTHLYLADLSS